MRTSWNIVALLVGAWLLLVATPAVAQGIGAFVSPGPLSRAHADLDRITGWTRVFGMVNSAPDFGQQPAVINGCSDLIIDLFGADVGAHSRSAVGMAALPFGMAVEIEAEVSIRI